MNIRKINENEYTTTETVIRASFWNVYKPGCDEHLMAHQIRCSKDYIPALDLVVEIDGDIVGCLMGTKAKIVSDTGTDTENVAAFGPIGVLPNYQGKGIGSFLMEQAIQKAKDCGYKGLVLYGNPAFYSRFGFVNAKKYGITMPDGNNIDDFMVLELGEHCLQGIQGKCFESDAFEVDAMTLAEFEKNYI